MLMSNTARQARLFYMANGFRVVSPGDHVLCAVTGAPIALEELRYWSVTRQQAFGSADAAHEALAQR